VRRRHADVDQSDVRTKIANAREQRVAIADLIHDFDVVLREQSRHPRGSEVRRQRLRRTGWTRDDGSPARLALDHEWRVERLEPVAQSRQPGVSGDVRPADAVVRDRDAKHAAVSLRAPTLVADVLDDVR
jgi:hypothetical protein